MKKAAQATVNHRLVNERLQRRWLQQDVADHLGTTPINVCRWERGITVPSAYFRQQLCALYEKSEQELGFASQAGSVTARPQPPPIEDTTDRDHPHADPSASLIIYVVIPFLPGKTVGSLDALDNSLDNR